MCITWFRLFSIWISEGTFGTFSVLFGTYFVFPCHAALQSGRVTSGRHAVLLSGRVTWLPVDLAATCASNGFTFFLLGFRRDVRHFFGVVWRPSRPSVPCCFAVQEGRLLSWPQKLEAVAETHATCSFSIRFRRDARHSFRRCLAPVSSFAAMLCCCPGGLVLAMATRFRSRKIIESG